MMYVHQAMLIIAQLMSLQFVFSDTLRSHPHHEHSDGHYHHKTTDDKNKKTLSSVSSFDDDDIVNEGFYIKQTKFYFLKNEKIKNRENDFQNLNF